MVSGWGLFKYVFLGADPSVMDDSPAKEARKAERAAASAPPPPQKQAPVPQPPNPQISLPPPQRPEGPQTIQGTMCVDVTQTDRTVDVWIWLSEEAKFIVQQSGLLDTPIEENFEGLKAHMQEFAADYDLETDIGIVDREPETSDPYLKAVRESVNEQANVMYRERHRLQKREKLEEEAQHYKSMHIVTLRSYLGSPYRKLVNDLLEASTYIGRLEKEYLPRIKAIIDAASSPKTRRWEY
jgi:hypothetical protein